MKALDRIRNIESVLGSSIGNFSISYEYDKDGKIIKQTSTGAIKGVTTYKYDEENNIIEEELRQDGKLITKTYESDIMGQLVKVDCKVETE